MDSIRTLAIVITVSLALLTCLTSAREENQFLHAASENAPASFPEYMSLSGDVSVGNLETLQFTSQKKIVTSKTDCGGHGGASGGYSGQGSGYGGHGGASGGYSGQGLGYGGSGVPVMPVSWGGQMGGSPGSVGGMIYSAAAPFSSVVGIVAFSALIVATGLH